MALDPDEPITLPCSLEKLQIMPDIAVAPKSIGTVNCRQQINPFDLGCVAGPSTEIDMDLFGGEKTIRPAKLSNVKNILHQKSFKSKYKQQNRKVLREPVLQFLNLSSSKIPKESVTDLHENYSKFNTLANDLHCNECRNKIVDFKTLVNECANLTLSSSMTSIPGQTIHSMKANQYRADRHPSKLSQLQSNCKNCNELVAHRTIAAVTEATAIASTSQSSLSSADSRNSSCSQQALMNASTCDVTIDELACYFETFVHIPKKMSTMAEMMYI